MTTRAKQGGFENWQELRDHLIDRYGTTPHPTAEQEIIDAYELHPTQIEKAALDLIDAAGITSPWGVLKKRAGSISSPPANPARSTSIEREKRIARAEQWTKTTGAHYDRQTEILEELFGDRGLLHPYTQITTIENGRNPEGHPVYELSEPTGDLALLERMTKLYDQARPAGITLEQDAEARAAKYRQQQAQIAAVKAQVQAARTSQPDLDYVPLPEIDYAADPDTGQPPD